MAKETLRDAFVSVNGADISDHVRSVSVESSRAEVDVTSMGAVNLEIIAGLGDVTITCEAFNDYAAGEIDALMFPLSQSDTPFTVIIRPKKAVAVSATNPNYTMQALLFGYNPVSGTVGEANMTPLTFRNASQTGLTRAVV